MKSEGNHQSIKEPLNQVALDKAFQKEVNYRWAIPIPINKVDLIKDACITPLGVATQWTLDDLGNRAITQGVDCIGSI